MSWRQDLYRVRNTDLVRLDLHLQDLAVTELDFRRLLTQYTTLKDRYDNLLTEKVVSDRQLATYKVETEGMLVQLARQKEGLVGEMKYQQENLKVAGLNNGKLKDNSKRLGQELTQCLNSQSHKQSLTKQLKCQTHQLTTQHSQLKSCVSSLTARQLSLTESLSRHKYMLESITNQLTMLKRYQAGTNIQLKNFEELSKEFNEKISQLLTKETVGKDKVERVTKEIQELTEMVVQKQRKVDDLKRRVREGMEERVREFWIGELLRQKIAEAENTLESKAFILGEIKRQVKGLQCDNHNLTIDNDKLADFLAKTNNQIDVLMDCTAQLMTQMEDCLQEDGRVKAILDRKYDSYRNLLLRFGRNPSAFSNNRAKISDSRTTNGTTAPVSRIRRNI